MVSQSFGGITAREIQGLCDRSVPEDHLLEFKETLPGDRGRIDPWIDGTGDPTAYAMDRLFREIIAFANYRGGTLILGVVETKTKPPRGECIQPLPRIHDLAARIEDAARDRIDLPIPGLQIRGIEIGDPGCGIIILRTPASSARPHRLKSNGQVYVRRGTASVPMNMAKLALLFLIARKEPIVSRRLSRNVMTNFLSGFRPPPANTPVVASQPPRLGLFQNCPIWPEHRMIFRSELRSAGASERTRFSLTVHHLQHFSRSSEASGALSMILAMHRSKFTRVG